MDLADEEMTAFRTLKKIYCYKVMPFGLKNADATYQRAMQKVFDNMLHKHKKCYVDDLVVKIKRRQDHLKDLITMFDRLQKEKQSTGLIEAKKENVVDFIRTHIIYWYCIPHRIVTDNGRQFFNSLIDMLCEKFKFKQYKSSMYNAAANGLVEAFNKTLCNLLKKIVSKLKRDWQEKIDKALWAYHTTHRTLTGVTLYSLVYGVEVVLRLEREIPSLRMAVQEGLTTEDNTKLRLQELEALDEKRLEAQ
ncbi:uncharacterized protein LOC120077205 [Benincasa hispida]|uniref:uncharacterized protein LOC120077205 n=1 Tax=Benincasa hispida TaxID=102211 RepID=UPI0018FF62B6|nr:uncharacterized protein LOC120077205 [Benincasa hispida]